MPLQKSYSDPNRSHKGQRQWQRSKSNPNPAQQAAPKPLPPLPVSDKTKSKLQAFICDSLPEVEPEHSETKEHAVDDIVKPEPKHKLKAPKDASLPTADEIQKVDKAKTHKAATPAKGIKAWKEILKPSEAPIQDKNQSPGERLFWRSDANPDKPVVITPLFTRKGRKRARSSSPVSSPAAKATAATPVDPKKLAHAAIKTPRADPALDLMERLRSDGVGATPSGLTKPLLQQLMVSCSPRPNQDEGELRGRSLRKSISCGSYWPKRRKLDRSNSDMQEGSGEGNSLPETKLSMVSALLETVNGEINKSKAAQAQQQPQKETIPSSSPNTLPGNKTPPDNESCGRTSPDRPPPESSPLAQKSFRGSSRMDDVLGNDGGAEAKNDGKDSSDYDDDDLDAALMELDRSISGLVQTSGSTLVAPSGAVANNPAPPPPKSSDEEFGDLDDDFLSQAIDLVTEVEARQPSQNSSLLVQQQQQDKPVMPVVGADDDEDDDDDDMYGGNDFDGVDLDEFEQVATLGSQAQAGSRPFSSNPDQKPRAIQRYLVTKVLEDSYIDQYQRQCPEKIIVVQAERDNSLKMVRLRDDWYDTQASPKAYVHIIGNFEPTGEFIIDNNKNLIILHPDQLISATVVADSFTCMRRAVLQDRVKAASDSSPALVYGTLLHEVFQSALMANRWDGKFLQSVVDSALKKHLEDLYVIRVSIDDARSYLMSKMPEMQSWAQTFVSATPKPNALVQGRNGERVNMCVSKLLDVEEHVWSPMYGLKGNIDATVQVTMRDGKTWRTLTVPFEVKTGKNATANHQAQTVLYNLLLSDRYDVDVVYGILYYMESSQTLRIPAIRHELRHMIMQRNQLACYIRERSVRLPPMKRNQNACSKCYAQQSCFTYHKLADDGNGETSGLEEKFEDLVKHLTPRHRDFFLKWEDLLTKEEKEMQKLRRELWTMVSTEREKLGRCFANVIIEEGSASESGNQTKINRFTYTFVKENPPPNFSFLESQLTVGEPIVVSDEQGHFALALGYVTSVKKHRITVAVDRRLHNARVRQPGFDEVNNQVFVGIMEVDGGKQKTKDEEPVRYRLDKDEFSNGMATVRNNLVQIMTDGPFGSKIRRLVVDLEPPQFKQTPTQYSLTGRDSLNVDQKAAVEKVMSAKDYALVLGMPGTGKTTTIAHIIRALVGQGKTLLLTSYTHTAVDNILLKLRHDNIPILRLGAPAKVHPEVQDFAILAGQPMSSIEEIRRAWHETPIVATTCLGINHPIFNERIFDYCIVDEASQITLPICLGPIRMARAFVLVGDHNQLPPLVQNEEARLGGLDISLFKLLSDVHPQSVVNLEHQYRMNEDIMTLSNILIYNGRLKCGTEALRHAELDIPDMNALRSRHFDVASFLAHSQKKLHTSPTKSKTKPSSFCPSPRKGTCWLADLLDPSARVRLVNTDPLLPLSREQCTARGNRIVNPCEAKLVAQLVDALIVVGVPAREIGVVTHYRSQLALLRHTLRGLVAGGDAVVGDVEMHTADRFQGRDKSVVILSLVRSNEQRSIGELLKDWRRVNVAFTRAKRKLLVVGSRSTLRGSGNGNAAGGDEEMLARFVRLMEERDWVYDLRKDALDGHFWPAEVFAATGASVPTQRQEVNVKGENGSPVKSSPKKGVVMGQLSSSPRGKENSRPGQAVTGKTAKTTNAAAVAGRTVMPKKTARINERAMMRGKPVLRDILNDAMDGGY